MHDFFDAFAEGVQLELDEIVAVGDDWVVGITSIVGQGASSGARFACAGSVPFGSERDA
jgi:hypothetical protein